jgi:lysyl-tRNA synthetase class 2
MSPELRLERLRDRARMLQRARDFFKERGILEVDPSALVWRAPIDANIDVIEAAVTDSEWGFLHTSPEYAMKRLLSSGCGDIYFLGHVFRKGEVGRLHNPEFTMAEWYRLSISFEEMIQETVDFLSLFFGPLPTRRLSYREAFRQYARIDYAEDDLSPLLPPHATSWTRDTAVHYLLTHVVEPHLGQDELTVLTDYPPSEAALARVKEQKGELVAERFEIYYQGVELTNGYHELGDASILRKRFERENEIRREKNQAVYLLDEAFLLGIGRGLPACCGVSVGFDRALMLRHKADTLAAVLPFTWSAEKPSCV